MRRERWVTLKRDTQSQLREHSLKFPLEGHEGREARAELESAELLIPVTDKPFNQLTLPIGTVVHICITESWSRDPCYDPKIKL